MRHTPFAPGQFVSAAFRAGLGDVARGLQLLLFQCMQLLYHLLLYGIVLL